MKMDNPTNAIFATIQQNDRPKPKRGFSVWLAGYGGGEWRTGKRLLKKDFGPHDYDDGGEYRGAMDCKCGCYMCASSSDGPVDPFGPCPMNPKPRKASK